MPNISALLIGISLVLILIWYRSRGTGRRLKKLESELITITRRQRSSERTSQYLVKVYSLLQKNIAAKDTPVCYQAVELLKGAYSAGIARPDELSNIVGVSVMALREKQFDIAGILVDCARLIVKRQLGGQTEQALEHLQLLATVALREKQNFIASKTTELIFYILERADGREGFTVTVKALTALRAIGVLVIRRRDSFMLRELIASFMDWYMHADRSSDTAVSELAAAWLHRSLYSSDPAAFEAIEELINKITEMRSLESDALSFLSAEIKNMAGTLSLDPCNGMVPRLVEILLKLGTAHCKVEHSRQAVKFTGEIVRMSVHNHDWNLAFPIVFPLLEWGRKMLTIELKFGGEASDGGYRQHTLFFIVKECLSIMEFAARKRMTDSVADIAGECIKIWQGRPETVHTLKSFRKFCGLVLLYHTASRRQRTSVNHQQMSSLTLFTEREQERLKVFIGGIQHELLSGTGRKV